MHITTTVTVIITTDTTLVSVGTELVRRFRSTYGETNGMSSVSSLRLPLRLGILWSVLASDIKTPPATFSMGPFKYLDVLNADDLARTCREVDQ